MEKWKKLRVVRTKENQLWREQMRVNKKDAIKLKDAITKRMRRFFFDSEETRKLERKERIVATTNEWSISFS